MSGLDHGFHDFDDEHFNELSHLADGAAGDHGVNLVEPPSSGRTASRFERKSASTKAIAR